MTLDFRTLPICLTINFQLHNSYKCLINLRYANVTGQQMSGRVNKTERLRLNNEQDKQYNNRNAENKSEFF